MQDIHFNLSKLRSGGLEDPLRLIVKTMPARREVILGKWEWRALNQYNVFAERTFNICTVCRSGRGQR